MRFPRRAAAAIASCLGFLACADADAPPRDLRVAVPPALAPALNRIRPPGKPPFTFVDLRPYARARDLEVLLFSSRSAAFQGVVVSGRSLSSLRPWLLPYEEDLPSSIRADVVASVGGTDPVALPLTMDFAALVVRRDLWLRYALPPPISLAALREGSLALRSRMPRLAAPIVSDLPVDELFWGLAWSFDGRADAGLYSYPKVHALQFIQEFDLARARLKGGALEGELRSGAAAAALTSFQRGKALCAADRTLELLPLPRGGGKAIAVYDGWALAKLACDGAGEARMRILLERAFQESLAKADWTPVASGMENGQVGRAALDGTTVHGAPDLGATGDEIVLEALRDATETPMTAEEALRRGAARLQARGRP